MSYLMSQIFMCLLGTALLFFALGWLVRHWFMGEKVTDNLIADSERSSWQTSLDGLKARLDAETGRKIAAEKALADATAQQSNTSNLLDQREGDVKQMQARIAELEAQQGGSANLAKERDALSAQVAALTAQASTRDQTLNAANADLQKQLADSTAKLVKLQVIADENTSSKHKLLKLQQNLPLR